MTAEDKKNEGAPATTDNANESEKGFTLSKQEMADVRAILKGSAEKDAKIEELSRQVAELSSREPSEPTIEENIVVGSKGTLKKTPNGDFIIGYEKRPNGRAVYKEVNPANQNEYLEYINLIVYGKDKPVKTLYRDFISDYQTEVVTFVRKEKREPEIVKEGKVEVTRFDEKSGEMVGTGRFVPAVVVNDSLQKVYVMIDGKEVEIDDKFLN